MLPIDPNSFKNGHAPSEAEILPSPLITDLDGINPNHSQTLKYTYIQTFLFV